jgi:hypothetical protein
MQSPEEFMLQYFGERLTEAKREMESRAPFHRKFHTIDCTWDSRKFTVEMLQSEKILSVSSSGVATEVITTRQTGESSIIHQLRYHLQASNDSWLIQSVDFWCQTCRGEKGKDSCILCHGTGWLNLKRLPAG